nr:8115_t:CDS:2 [Entrophospora candida]
METIHLGAETKCILSQLTSKFDGCELVIKDNTIIATYSNHIIEYNKEDGHWSGSKQENSNENINELSSSTTPTNTNQENQDIMDVDNNNDTEKTTTMQLLSPELGDQKNLVCRREKKTSKYKSQSGKTNVFKVEKFPKAIVDFGYDKIFDDMKIKLTLILIEVVNLEFENIDLEKIFNCEI